MRACVSLRTLLAAAFAAEKPPMTVRTGRHGERVGLLGYGAMRLPTVDGGHANPWGEGCSKAAIDQKRLDAQVDWMLAHGVTYFDSSPLYCRGASEAALGRALSRHPRGSYQVSTKMSNFLDFKTDFRTSVEMFARSLKNFATDHLDYYYIHNIGSGGWANFQRRFIDNGLIDWIEKRRAEGAIRNLGFSYHGDPRTLEWCLKQHDAGLHRWDMALIQMNYVDWHHAKAVDKQNLDAAYLYGELTRRGIQVTVMEPMLGGRLARHNDATAAELTPLDPEATPASWALRFCGSHANVLTVLSGMTFQEHIEENVRTFSPLKPLSKEEFLALERAAEAYLGLGAIPCTACEYCMPCPYGLDIPALLGFMNEVRMQKLTDARRIRALYERAVPDPRRRAERCIGCGRCAPHCPQAIDIPKALDGVAGFMEGLS